MVDYTSLADSARSVVVGSVTYTFNTVLGGANSVLIGDSITESLRNLTYAINASGGIEGTNYGTGTVQNTDAGAIEHEGFAVMVFAREGGPDGNSIASTTTVTGATWNNATLFGGVDNPAPQRLSFPRTSLYDRDGTLIQGVPLLLKQAAAEYSVRAKGAILLPDPTVDGSGRAVKRQKIGPIETEYVDGSAIVNLIKPYPAADRLLVEFLKPKGVIRG